MLGTHRNSCQIEGPSICTALCQILYRSLAGRAWGDHGSDLTWSRLFFWGARRTASSGLISMATRALETGATSSKSSFSGIALRRTGTTCKHREHVNARHYIAGTLQQLSWQDGQVLLLSPARPSQAQLRTYTLVASAQLVEVTETH